MTKECGDLLPPPRTAAPPTTDAELRVALVRVHAGDTLRLTVSNDVEEL